MEKVNRYIEVEGSEDFLVDLFPYKVKNQENFYFRDHPENLNPRSFSYKKYWGIFKKRCLEGLWVNDNGTWVFMMPKLFFYINYVIISDEKRERIHPRLMDNVWIMFTYFLCCEGFSGFEGDDKYTCNKYVGMLQKGEKLQPYELRKLEASEFVKNSKGEYKQYVEPWEYLTETYLINDNRGKPLGQALYDNGYYHCMLLCARATFKALKLDTPVLSENGWKAIQDIAIGDRVYGSDGKLCNVTNTSGVLNNLNMFRLTLSDGRIIDACEDHLWKVWYKDKSRRKNADEKDSYLTVTTGEMFKKYYYDRIDSKHKKRHGEVRYVKESIYSLPLNEPIGYNNADLPIDPYFLGLWLGDGGSTRASITTADKQIVEYCYKVAEEHNLKISINENKSKTCPSYHISSGIKVKGEDRNTTLIDKFKSLNLFNNKHIPDIYKCAGIEQRLELLRGLMDSDGSAGQGYAYFSNSNKNLAYEVLDLVRSLGMYAHIVKRDGMLNGVKYKDNFNVVIKTDKKIFNLDRKNATHKKYQPKGNFGTGRLKRVSITSIEKVENADGCCITVDNYDNTYITKDFIVTHNSYNVFMGLFLHEWLFGGARRIEQEDRINDALLFGLASSQSDALSRSIGNLDRAYFSFPGQFDFPTKKKGKTVKYWGPFYKNTRGQWKVEKGSNEVRHLVKTKQGKTVINGSQCQIQTITPKNEKIFTGDRFRMGIIEEGGFCKNLKDIYIACKDAFSVGDDQVGMLIIPGTGGDMEYIKDAKEMFENPEFFNIYGIPNYWERGKNKKCGLMVGANYKKESLKENGNTLLKESLIDIIRYREKAIVEMDHVSFAKDLAFNPIYPKELLKPINKSPLPIVELASQRENIIDMEVMSRLSVVGSLKYRNSKVVFVPDLENTLEPILEWGRDEKLTNNVGAWVIHEQPPAYIPEDLYYILYDPYAQSGEGTSLQAIYVYKYRFKNRGIDDSLEDTIVASYVGRLSDLDTSYEEAIKAAHFFNGKVFPELNNVGFAEYVDRKGLRGMMMHIPKAILEPIKGSTASSHGRSAYGFGIKTNEAMNIWAIHRLAQWLVNPTERDEKTQIPTKFTYQKIRDLRFLSEAVNFVFENKVDYDAMSAMMLLPYLLSYLDGLEVDMPDQYETMIDLKYKPPQRERRKVLVSKLSATI